MSTAATPGVNILLQNATTTGNGRALGIPPGIKYHTFYVKGNGTIGAGAITLETADDPDYAGTWAPLPAFTDPLLANPITVVSNTQKVYNYVGSLAAVRARISTTVTTSTVSVIYRGT